LPALGEVLKSLGDVPWPVWKGPGEVKWISNKKAKVMNTQFIKSNWKKLKGTLKQKYAQLTGDDLKYVEGKGTISLTSSTILMET